MGPDTFSSWQIWAALSAIFAALTAIFAKIGVEDVNPDLATFLGTIIVLISLALILLATGQLRSPGCDFGKELAVPDTLRPRHRRHHGCVISAR